MLRLPDIPDNTIALPPVGRLQESVHVFSERERLAIDMALTTGRALLVRGEPGAGKSQLARAAAAALGRPFVRSVVDARTESSDLLWHFDRVARLARAQIIQALGKAEQAEEELAPHKFVTPGPLWRALSWKSAEVLNRWPHNPPAGWQPAQGIVLLIDEIDKADSSVPSGLLSVLGEGTFATPGGAEIACDNGQPLVVITTNEDRMLPDAFVRRCLVLQIRLPETRSELANWLCARGRAHFPYATPELLEKAAELVHGMREKARRAGMCPPGLAEYIDLLRAVHEWDADSEAARLDLLDRLAPFALDKHPREQQ